MAENNHLDLGRFLIQQRRFRDAEQEIRKSLAADPASGRAHSLLAAALAGEGRWGEAIKEAQQGVRFSPNDSYSHYAEAYVLHEQNFHREALRAIQEAIRIDPEDADYYQVSSAIYMNLDEAQRALEAARAGLALDPLHTECMNLESIALVRLGRQNEAGVSIQAALERDPDNASSHANLGWNLLSAGKHQDALNHFREALCLDPTLEYARQGIVESMRARNILYRPILSYFLLLGRIPGWLRWGLILALLFLIRFLRDALKTNPNLAPVIGPILGLYLLFVFTSWIARPLFNLALRLDRIGRMALSPDEIAGSNWLGLCVFGGLALLLPSIPIKSGPMSLSGLALLAMALPVAGIFQARSSRARIILSAYSGFLALTGLAATGIGLLNSIAGAAVGVVFILGWVLYTWVGNIIIERL